MSEKDISENNNLQILDCTIRDGGYLNNWNFDKKMVTEIIKALSQTGIDIIEIGFKTSEKYYDKDNYGPWRFCEEKDLQDVIKFIDKNNIKIGAMVDFGKISLQEISDKEDSYIDIIRVAAHKNRLDDALGLIKNIKLKGYATSLQMMGFSTFSKKERESVIKLIQNNKPDYAYIADSYGSILPYQINELFEPLLQIPDVKIGFHPHNNLQMGFANAIEAIRCGVDIIDGSMYGMGRGAGNLPIEIVLSYLQQKNKNKYNVMPVLHCIDKYFVDFKRNIGWGYTLPYMLSGLFNNHPYYAKKLIDWREYTIDDVWEVLEQIREKKPIGFSESLLKSTVNNVFKKEIKGKPLYLDRHIDRNFLVLANGPSLINKREIIKEFIEKYQPIILGANFLNNLYNPDYHAFTNKRRFIDYVSTVDKNSSLILDSSFKEDFIRSYTDRNYEIIYHNINPNEKFNISNGIITTSFYTVSALLIPVAYVMGAKNIFVAGMDGYNKLDNNIHFYRETDEAFLESIELEKQSRNEELLNDIQTFFINNNINPFKIITPTSYDVFYQDIKILL